MNSGKSRISFGDRNARSGASRLFLGSGASFNQRSMSQASQKGSPTQHYRRQMARTEEMFDRVYDLNSFIHKGIDKFLDKQAVRDLITEYDNNDIYIGGEDEFYSALQEELQDSGEVNFSRTEKRRLQDILNRLNIDDSSTYNGTKIGIPKDAKFAWATRVTNGMNGNGALNGNAGKDGKTSKKRRTALWTSLFSAIRIKVFSTKQRIKSARRRESELFSTYP